jgi:outer membrane protein assembly factor BamB
MPSEQLFKLTPSDLAAEDFFGIAVAASGKVAIIGSEQDDRRFPNGRVDENAGAAYLFDLTTGQQLHKLTASDGAQQDLFGHAVGIFNTTAIVGARFDDDGATAAGSAYVFDALTGNQLLKLTASDSAAFDLFGDSVAISDHVAIVGAPGDDDGAPGAGSAYLFNRTTGQQQFKLTASMPAESDGFGSAVAVSNTIALVGAPRSSTTGAAYAFDISTGQELFKFTPSDVTPGAFGNAVAISGNIAIVGAYLKNDVGTHSGAAYLFDLTTGQQLHKLVPSNSSADDHFGFSVAIDGNLALIGAQRDIFDSDPRTGSAFVFDVSTGEQLLTLHGSDTVDRDRFGGAVALSNTFALVGAYSHPSPFDESGAAYVFSVVPEPATGSLAAVFVSAMVCAGNARKSPSSESATVLERHKETQQLCTKHCEA